MFNFLGGFLVRFGLDVQMASVLPGFWSAVVCALKSRARPG